jgi:hypothetical protein
MSFKVQYAPYYMNERLSNDMQNNFRVHKMSSMSQTLFLMAGVCSAVLDLISERVFAHITDLAFAHIELSKNCVGLSCC